MEKIYKVYKESGSDLIKTTVQYYRIAYDFNALDIEKMGLDINSISGLNADNYPGQYLISVLNEKGNSYISMMECFVLLEFCEKLAAKDSSIANKVNKLMSEQKHRLFDLKPRGSETVEPVIKCVSNRTSNGYYDACFSLLGGVLWAIKRYEELLKESREDISFRDILDSF